MENIEVIILEKQKEVINELIKLNRTNGGMITEEFRRGFTEELIRTLTIINMCQTYDENEE